MKLCVIFPGMGYTCERPLLAGAAELAREAGYEVIPLTFTGLMKGDKKDLSTETTSQAFVQAAEALTGVNFAAYERVVFIGKSIGTMVCTAYSESRRLDVQHILFTPLKGTFDYTANNACAFHGTKDPWAPTAAIKRLCAEKGVKLYLYPGANHSLITGDEETDSRYQADAMEKIQTFLN